MLRARKEYEELLQEKWAKRVILFWDILDEDFSHFSKSLEQQIQQDEQKLEKNKGILEEFRAQSNEKVHTTPFSTDVASIETQEAAVWWWRTHSVHINNCALLGIYIVWSDGCKKTRDTTVLGKENCTVWKVYLQKKNAEKFDDTLHAFWYYCFLIFKILTMPLFGLTSFSYLLSRLRRKSVCEQWHH